MNTGMKAVSLLSFPFAVLLCTGVASAQWEDEGADAQSPPDQGPTDRAAPGQAAPDQAPPPAYTDSQAPVSAPPPLTLEAPDGPRFRGGIAFTGGREFVSNADFSATMFGVDGRLGVQLSDLFGLYVEPHLSFGSAGGIEGSTGTFAAVAMADFTFLDALFVGAGFGYGVFNNPSGPALGLRAGGYPVKRVSTDKPRRVGLVLSLESRFVFLGDPFGTGIQIMGAIGYEAF
jgi:hypothetical protein